MKEAGLNSIDEALQDFERRFLNAGERWLVPESHKSELRMRSGILTLIMDFDPLPPHLPPPKEFALVMKAIHGLYFAYKEQPRQIDFQLDQDRVALASCSLSWGAFNDPWPKHLPWEIKNSRDDLTMVIFYYGMDFGDNHYLAHRLGKAMHDIREWCPTGIPSRAGVSVSFDVLKVDIEPLPNTRLELPTNKILSILNEIYRQTMIVMQLWPRDFAVRVEIAGYPGVMVFFTIIDPRDGIAQE
ncbi:MAG: hypothetical protein Q9207_008453 [Kuettlingeria erythrocarpa]